MKPTAGVRRPEEFLPTDPYAQRSAVTGVRWSLVGVVTSQVFQVVCALALARMLGPASYGIISAASIYLILTILLLDQGLSAALVQRPQLTTRAPGAVATLNLCMALALGLLTWLGAPYIAGFFNVPELAAVLVLLGGALVVKAVGIVPRAMLSRNLRFRAIALAEVTGAGIGAVCGISAALAGASYFAVVFQVIAADLTAGVIVLAAARWPRPNLHLGELRPLLRFSVSIFGVNALAYFSRNLDNILVGRFLGVTALSLYGMAYRVLAIPVMLLGQTVNRVMFPVFSRTAADRKLVAANLLKAMHVLAMLVIPVMAFTACAAPRLIDLVLGENWAAAAPLLSVLAIAGARETVFFIAPSLMRGMGRADLNLRYEVLATVAQVSGIVVGLQFGLVWVAVGYAAGGFLLTPVLLFIQRRLSGAGVLRQLSVLWPPVHAGLWASGAYLLLERLDLGGVAALSAGFGAFSGTYLVVMVLVHRRRARQFLGQLRTLTGVGLSGASGAAP
ncbi:lipopolysaccharide biosynthesis protein [Arthrobacter sp. 260]|uniref:lipopolysaccharide biosynthesis protein n=1 Tax=Arthrobacter sp. 260 TaxID=2735314 RepID=UPI001492C09D|nr:lipopolysaccharide biosynthesis protein [Arthrobacter sp. 260]NOJ60738.1 lipopolysaccharide biosynthesis protein [Arthrobacter sp. 260]